MNVPMSRLLFILTMMLLLSIVPLPSPLSFFRPLWLLLFIIYLQSTRHKLAPVWLVLLFGLLLDVLGSGILGLQAFALLLTTYIVSKRALRFRLFPMTQQLLGITAFCGIYQFVLGIMQYMWGYPSAFMSIFCPIIMSTLCWPWFQYFGDRLLFSPIR